MRTPNQLVYSRARTGLRYSLFPLEGYPASRIPSWGNAVVKVLASPAMGAKFVQYLIDVPAEGLGYFPADEEIETFYYVMSGDGAIQDGQTPPKQVRAGSFGLLPPGVKLEFGAKEATSLLILRKRYEPYHQFEIGTGATKTLAPIYQALHSHESKVEAAVWADNPHSRLQTLIPDEWQYDIAMNIFTFDPGHGLPYVETHVMEHGLYYLQGKGLYYLEDSWTEVEAHDFIWMGPFCPQSFYATGPMPSKYIYYKNVNREIQV